MKTLLNTIYDFMEGTSDMSAPMMRALLDAELPLLDNPELFTEEITLLVEATVDGFERTQLISILPTIEMNLPSHSVGGLNA